MFSLTTEPIIVIGGGAAGLMAAGRAGEKGARVILLEKNRVLGRKVRISGKGRCNVTNAAELRAFIENYPGNGGFLYSAFHKFFNDDLRQLLESLGVLLKVERGGRVFPRSDQAADIVNALERYLQQGAVAIRTGETVRKILFAKDRVIGVKTTGGIINTSCVIVATGGKSYAATGSTGDGYRWAQEAGHTISPLRPALAPLNIREEWVKELQGLSLKNVEAVLRVGDKVLGREFGEMLFTHFGVSGPIILTLSRWVARDEAPGDLLLQINLKPSLDVEKLDNRLQRDFQTYQRKQIKNALDDLLPKRLIPVIIRLSGISPEKFVHQITRKERAVLIELLTALPLFVSGCRPLDEAIVTAGGVSLKEINPKTMESKLVQGLYFAGEVLDIDGYTGGYNLQAAFSTGYVAGDAAAGRLGY